MVLASICALKGNPSCLLLLWETLQGQKVGLTQAPFKLLPLRWVSGHVKFCMSHLRVESVSYSPLALLYANQLFWGLYSQCRTPRLGSPMWGSDPSPLG